MIKTDCQAFKEVDLVHAGRTSRGSVKIGNLRSYATLEDEVRNDAEDGSLTRTISDLRLTAEASSEAGEALKRKLGMSLQSVTSGVHFKNTKIVEVSPNYWCYCMSIEAPPPRAGKAVFRIASVLRYLGLVTDENTTPLGRKIKIDRVRYHPRTLPLEASAEAEADPFVKDILFEDDRELRAIWLGDPLVTPWSTSLPLITPENEELADLLERVS